MECFVVSSALHAGGKVAAGGGGAEMRVGEAWELRAARSFLGALVEFLGCDARGESSGTPPPRKMNVARRRQWGRI